MTTDAEVFDALTLRVVVDELGTHRYYNSKGKLHRDAGPALIFPNGTGVWYRNGLRHRTYGPAVIFDNGDKIWYQNGLLQRKDGPAVERSDGHREWWINGKQCPQAEFHEQLKSLEIKDG